MQQVLGKLNEFGATICAITPQFPEASRSLIERHKISFDLLSDHGNQYIGGAGPLSLDAYLGAQRTR